MNNRDELIMKASKIKMDSDALIEKHRAAIERLKLIRDEAEASIARLMEDKGE